MWELQCNNTLFLTLWNGPNFWGAPTKMWPDAGHILMFSGRFLGLCERQSALPALIPSVSFTACLQFPLLFSLGIPAREVPPTCLRENSGTQWLYYHFLRPQVVCKGQTPGRLPGAPWRPSVLWWATRLSWISSQRRRRGKCDVRMIPWISPPRLSHQTPMFIEYIELSSCYNLWCQAAAPHPEPASSAAPLRVWIHSSRRLSRTLHKQALSFRQNRGKNLYFSCLQTRPSALTLFDLFPVVEGV